MDGVRIGNALFRPFASDVIELPNRLVMAPMTRARAEGGVLSDASIDYYRRRAEAGVGLFITEGTWIDHPVASDRKAVPRFYGDDALAGWKRVIDAVHDAGGKMFPQLWHVGTATDRSTGFNPHLPAASPSGVSFGDSVEDRRQDLPAMTAKDIDDIVDAFATAAANAHALGFDGIELHGAHGYLIDQFFWSATNVRRDSYNGSVSDRARFAAEVVRECKARTHKAFPVSLRFSQWKMVDYEARLFDDGRELAAFVEPLVDAGVDIFHCSTRRYWEPAFSGSDLTLAGWTRKISGKPTIAVGSVGLDRPHQVRGVERAAGYTTTFAPIDRLVELLERDEFDLVAVGRALLADHRWPAKIRTGAWDEIVPYSSEMRGVMY